MASCGAAGLIGRGQRPGEQQRCRPVARNICSTTLWAGWGESGCSRAAVLQQGGGLRCPPRPVSGSQCPTTRTHGHRVSLPFGVPIDATLCYTPPALYDGPTVILPQVYLSPTAPTLRLPCLVPPARMLCCLAALGHHRMRANGCLVCPLWQARAFLPTVLSQPTQLRPSAMVMPIPKSSVARDWDATGRYQSQFSSGAQLGALEPTQHGQKGKHGSLVQVGVVGKSIMVGFFLVWAL